MNTFETFGVKEEKKEEIEGNSPISKKSVRELSPNSRGNRENDVAFDGSSSNMELESKYKGTELLLTSPKLRRKSIKKKMVPLLDNLKKVEEICDISTNKKFIGLVFTDTIEDLDKMKIFKFYFIENNFDFVKKKNKKRRIAVKNLKIVKNRKFIKT